MVDHVLAMCKALVQSLAPPPKKEKDSGPSLASNRPFDLRK
jgi:hypothetical protein